MPVRAVFFDLGGTLFRYGDLRERFEGLLAELLVRHGVEAEAERARDAYRAAMARQFLSFARRPFYLHRDLFAAAERDFLAQFGTEPRPDPAHPPFYEGQRDLGGAVRPRADAAATLGALRERGLHLGVVSNIDDDQFHPLWESIGLADYFDATTTSEEARSCKPDPAIFEFALAKAPGVRAEEVVFVGDSPHHDVGGARAFGMRTVLIADREPGQPEPAPHHVIRQLGELLEIV